MDPYAFDEDAGYITSLERRQRKSADRADTHRFFGVITIAFISFSALLMCSELQAFMLKPEQALTGRVVVELYRFISGLLHLPIQLYDGLRDVAWTLNAVVYGPDFESKGLTVARGLVSVLSSVSLSIAGLMCGLLLLCGGAINPSRRSDVLLSVVWLLLPVIVFRGWWHVSCWLSLRPSTEASMCLGSLSLLCTLCQSWQVHSELQRGMAGALLPPEGWRRALHMLVMRKSSSSQPATGRGGRVGHSKRKADHGLGGHKRGSAAGRGHGKPGVSSSSHGGDGKGASVDLVHGPPVPHNPARGSGSPVSNTDQLNRSGKGHVFVEATNAGNAGASLQNPAAPSVKKPVIPSPLRQTSAEAETILPDPTAFPADAHTGGGKKRQKKKAGNATALSISSSNLVQQAVPGPIPRPLTAALRQLESQVERSGHSNASSVASSTTSSYSRYGAGGSPLPSLPAPPHHALNRISNSSSTSSNNSNTVLQPSLPAAPHLPAKRPGTAGLAPISRTDARPPVSTSGAHLDPVKPTPVPSKPHAHNSAAAATGNSLAALIASHKPALNTTSAVVPPSPPPKRSSVVSPAIGSFAAAAAAGVAKLKAAVSHAPSSVTSANIACAAPSTAGAKQPQSPGAASKQPPQSSSAQPGSGHVKASKHSKQQHQQNTPPAQHDGTAPQSPGKPFLVTGEPNSPLRTTPPVSPKPLNPAAPVFRYNPFNATSLEPSFIALGGSPATSPTKTQPSTRSCPQQPQHLPHAIPAVEQLVTHKHVSGDLDISSVSANYSPFFDPSDPCFINPAGIGLVGTRQKVSLGSDGEFSFFSMPLPASNSPVPDPTAPPASRQQLSHQPEIVQANTWTYSFPAIAAPSPASRAYLSNPLSAQPRIPPLTTNSTWQYDPLAVAAPAATLSPPTLLQAQQVQPTSARRPEDAQSAGTTLITRLIMAATAHKSPRGTALSPGASLEQPIFASPLASPQAAHNPFSTTQTAAGCTNNPVQPGSPPLALSAAFSQSPIVNAAEFTSHASAFSYGFDRYTQPVAPQQMPHSATASEAVSVKSPGDLLPSLSDYGFVTDDDPVVPFALPVREDSVDGSSGRMDDAGNLCTICWVRPRRVGFLHGTTSHFCVCRTCAATMREGDLCVLCRAPIERIIDVY